MVQKEKYDRKKNTKRYIAIIKIGNNPDGSAKCLKYRFNNLLKFTDFLNQKWPGWKWYNVYFNNGKLKGKQAGNFTKYNPPVKAIV